MALGADLQAWAMQKLAPLTVRYGRDLAFAGTELPTPRRVSATTRRGRVRCHVYAPRSSASGAYVHLHGGAFVMRYPQMDDWFARLVAAGTGAAVINVDYDVAPQVRYPVAQEQAHDVLAWACGDGAREIGHDPDRVAIGGFSAGGNLAASAVLQARDADSCRPAYQLLGVPSLDVAETDKPFGGSMIGPELIRLVRATYFKDAARRTEPYASPLRAASLEGLPPTMVVTGERDALRREGDAYAVRLAEAGVPTEHVVVPGADHYFTDGPRDRAKEILDRIVGGLRGAVTTG